MVIGFSRHLAVGLLTVFSATGLRAADIVLEEFAESAVSLRWQIVNDDVMGGVSRSSLNRVDAETVRFLGRLSLENNGGFASVRASGRMPDLTEAQAIVIRAKGDGRTYQLRLRMANGWRAPDYSAEFATQPGQWQIHVLPLTSFVAGWRGRSIRNAPPINPAKILSVGLLLGDKNPGGFSLDIDWIKAIRDLPPEDEAGPAILPD